MPPETPARDLLPVLAPAPLGRLLVAAVTPFRTDGTVDVAGFERHLDGLARDGADGVVVGGTTGEGTTLTDDERIDLVACAVDVVGGRAAVVAASGSADTAHSVVLSQAAEEAGADALMVVTPYYCCPTQAGLLAHLWTVADATDLPVLLYDVPRRTGSTLAEATLARAAQHPNVVAIKEAGGDLDRLGRVAGDTGLACYAGDDPTALPALAAGAVGLVGVAANVAASSYRRLLDAAAAGDLADAVAAHRDLRPLARALSAHVPQAVATKAVLHALGRIDGPRVRLPLVGPEPEEAAAIVADLAAVPPAVDPALARVALVPGALAGGALQAHRPT
ncbi:4-hydroxy-tetrahydrodipicolinate synthase [Krasilnikoviella flava]|uniref:4-hydroxy-tetrahydrodipicolinate synthase n=1 Tax=Krasilnikoviella flava TaxID=526729 RepID=A0A1T5M1Q7_9MICO|nr:4-hydroxy-tetrahydrodipicolinate synthase [Krasilnikoviella flava]SKC81728.1 4-hydroxy-tetrahydrodipicolinate synthase [Krasilnikoviella flava]